VAGIKRGGDIVMHYGISDGTGSRRVDTPRSEQYSRVFQPYFM